MSCEFKVVIPARYGSSRLPGKPLISIAGRAMVLHVCDRAKAAGAAEIVVATDDARIQAVVEDYGFAAVMTSSAHESGTERLAEVAALYKWNKDDIIVNLQGDEPLIHPETIGETIVHFHNQSVNVVNIMSRLNTKKAFEDKNNVKVVVDKNNDALYYSREPIPSSWNGWENIPRYMQTGVIAFRRDTLIAFNAMPETCLEQIESVDMNRILETGGKIRMVLTDAITIGVDVPEELKAAEVMLKDDELLGQYL